MIKPIPFAGLGVAAAAFVLSAVNDLAMIAVSVANDRSSVHLGLSLPALVCVICGAATYYDRSRFTRLVYLASAAAGLLIVILNMLRHGQLSFISEQVAIASTLLVCMIALYGVSPSDLLEDDDDRPVRMNPFFTP